MGDDTADLFRGYTVEGECVYLKVDAAGQTDHDKQMSIMWSTKLVQMYQQQWAEEQAKLDEDHIISASDAHPFVWGADVTISKIFTAMFFT